jgi:hypothetical protein
MRGSTMCLQGYPGAPFVYTAARIEDASAYRAE